MRERVLGWLYPDAPALRLALLRALVGAFATVYLLIRSPNLISASAFHPGEFRPVGVVGLLSAPLPAWALYGSVALSCLTGAAFTLGYRFRWLGPAFAVLLLWVTSYRSSWGMIFHTDNLLTLHVAVLALSPAADALSWDARGHAEPEADGRYGRAIRLMAMLMACTYVVAGVAKLKLAGAGWLGGELLRAQIAFDNLRKLELGSSFSSLGVWLIRHPAVFAPLSLLTLVLELGAPLALVHRRLAWAFAVLAWSFHLGIALLMHIGFPYPLSFIAYLPLFQLERFRPFAHVARLLHPSG